MLAIYRTIVLFFEDKYAPKGWLQYPWFKTKRILELDNFVLPRDD